MKNVVGALVLVIAIWAIAATFRAYRIRTDAQLAAQRANVEERDTEAKRRASAEQEALRLKELQAQQEAAEAERALAELRAQQAAAEAANAEREAQAARMQAELEVLRREKTAAEGEARQLADQRKEEIERIREAETEALAKLRGLDLERVTSRDRDEARAAAIARQIELEKRAQEQLAKIRAARAR